MNEEKARLRKEMIAKRDALPAQARERFARTIVEKLAALPQYRAARSVLATMSIGSEWSTRPFLDRARADGKALLLPRITDVKPKRLQLHRVGDLDRDLRPGVWDIPEPDPARCPEAAITDVDFALVPALAVDREGFRLGYGAGYFDKLLAARGPNTFCVTALPSPFVVHELPHEAHDTAIHLIVSDAGTIPVKRAA
jgi:5,10-methenyltetrahydrofolate synthetase